MRTLMKVLKNLFGNNTKISADSIAVKDLNNKTKLLDNCVIVDSGTNINGTYIKWGNGLMICTKRVTGSVNINEKWGNIYDTGSQKIDFGDWAMSFIDIPELSIQFKGANGQWIEGISDVTASHTCDVVIASATSKTANFIYDLIGVGRWK